MIGKKKNKVHSLPPSKAVLHHEQQLSLMLQQVSSQLNLMLSLQQQQQQQQQQQLRQQHINHSIGICELCIRNEMDRQQAQCHWSCPHGPYQNDLLTRPVIPSYSQPNFCPSSRAPCPPHQPCSPSASSFLSTTHASSCLHDPSRYHHDHYSPCFASTLCHTDPLAMKQTPLSDPFSGKPPTRTTSRSFTFDVAVGNNDGNNNHAPLAPVTENLFKELSWTDIYRQDLRARPDALVTPPASSSMQTSTISTRQGNFKSGRSYLHGWWLHGKYKWNQIKKSAGRMVLL